MGLYFHQLSKDISMGGQVHIPKDQDQWPESWKTIVYKEYPTVSEVVPILDKSECIIDKGFSEVLQNRTTKRNFRDLDHYVTLKEISTIINHSIVFRDRENENRMTPSGGGRYPLEYYVLIQRSKELKRGIYHFNVKRNTLEFILDLTDKQIPIFSAYSFALEASCVFFVTSVFSRTTSKYGERGYRYILLEAGHAGQNIMLAASAQGLVTCPIGGSYDVVIDNMLGLDGESESTVYVVLVG